MSTIKFRKEDILSILSISNEDYSELIEGIKEGIKGNVEYRKEEMTLSSGMKISTGNLLTTLELLNIFHKTAVEIDDIMKCVDVLDIKNPSEYPTYFDEIIETFLHYTDYESFMVAEYIKEAIDNLTKFSSEYVLYQRGSTVSLFDIIKLYKKRPRLKELMLFEIDDPTLSVSELNDIQASNKDEAISIFLEEDLTNPYTDYIRSGAGINLNQMTEVLLTIMYKPDMYGNVIPIPIFTSFVRGLKNVQQYFIDCIGCRTSLIISKIQVKQSGYFNRKVSSATIDCKLSNTINDCKTLHTVNYKVENKDKLREIIDRYVVVGNKLKIVTKQDTQLVGHNVNLRSPGTCALPNGEICETCYGELAQTNKYRHIGTIANLVLTEPITQKLLSTKHLLKVVVDVIKFSEQFKKYLTLYTDKLVMTSGDFDICIDKDKLIENENREKDNFSLEEFSIRTKKGTNIELKSPTTLILSNSIGRDIDKYYDAKNEIYVIKGKDIIKDREKTKDENYVFKIIINNKGVADPLIEVKNSLEKNKTIIEVKHDYSELLNKIIDNLISSGTFVSSVHIEVILRTLTRTGDNNDKTLFGSSVEKPNEIIYNMTDAILHNSESPVQSLLYQNIYRQLMSDSNSIFTKVGNSKFDQIIK